MFKKTAIALAVAGAYGMSLPASAMTTIVDEENNTSAGFYAGLNASVNWADTDNGGVSLVPTPADADGEVYAWDGLQSRFGFVGETDLGNGMKGSARFEMGFGGEGLVDEDTTLDKRLGWVQLSGDFGSVKLGNQWGVLYPYLGYTTFRSIGLGASTYYETTSLMNHDGFGLRVNDTLQYQYGGGGYSTDPFTFTVQGVMDRSDGGAVGGTDETFDAYAFGGAATFANITVGGAYYGENNGPAAEPSMWGVSVRASVTDALWLGARYASADRDDGSDDVTTADIHAEFDFGNGISTMAGYGTSDNEVAGDLDMIFLQINKNLGTGLNLYSELEIGSRDQAGGDAESTVFTIGMKKDL